MKKILVSLFVLLTMSSCNQTGLAVGTAVKNFFTTPFRIGSHAISAFQYGRVAKRQNDDNLVPMECKVKQRSVSEGLGNLEQLQDAVRQGVCRCSPWGSCTTAECPCKNLCPDNFDIFKRPEIKSISDLSKLDNSLAFSNGGGGSKHEVTRGYCWGHASVTTKFNRLAFFKPDAKPKYPLKGASSAEEHAKAVNYYKGLIDKVIDNEPVDIPGVSNLFELSENPDLQSYIADKVSNSWAKNAMTFHGLAVASSARPMTEKRSDKFITDVEEKLKLNQQPQIVFTKKNEHFDTHAVLISHIKEENGVKKLCVRDNNEPRHVLRATWDPVKKDFEYHPMKNHMFEFQSIGCLNYIAKKPDGSLEYIDDTTEEYRDWGDLGHVAIGHNDDSDAVEQFENLKAKCDKEKGCSN
jgi:hypothetical protein